jgi:predicted ATP-grasp superfamily ATP-dependent carboligase
MRRSARTAGVEAPRHGRGADRGAQRLVRRRQRTGRVLVLGEESGVVLPIVRSLGRAGLDVHLAWTPPGSPATASRHVGRLHDLPFCDGAAGRWLPPLASLIESVGFDLVLPATETASVALHGQRPRLERIARLALPSDRAFRVAFNKARTYELAASLGIRIPATRLVRTPEEIDAALDAVPAPCIVKPVQSVAPDRPTSKCFARLAGDRHEADAFARFLHGQGLEALVQEAFAGAGVGVELLAHRGQVLFAFQHLRLHETIGYGSTYRESVPLDPDLVAAASALVGALEYTGVAMVEFRMDLASLGWVLLEMNGRFWGSLPLAIAAGADFPARLYQLLVEGRREFPGRYRVGIRSRSLAQDARWVWRNLTGRATPTDPSADDGWSVNRMPWRRVAADVLRAVSIRDRFDTFAWHDPWPAAIEAGQLIGLAARRMTKRR